MTLTEFVTARLDEVEAEPGWHEPMCDAVYSDYQECNCRGAARVLADVATKRAIVAWCSDVPMAWVGPGDHDFAPGVPSPEDTHILGLLASVYSQHPDFDAAWKV